MWASKRILIPSLVIAAAITIGIATTIYTENTPAGANNSEQNSSDDISMGSFAETPGYSIDGLSKHAKYIVVGNVVQNESVSGNLTGLSRAYNDITMDVERELTGAYEKSHIEFRTIIESSGNTEPETYPNSRFVEGQRYLVFLADKEPDTVWGDNYYVMGLTYGKYDLVGGKAYGRDYPEGIFEKELIDEIMAK